MNFEILTLIFLISPFVLFPLIITVTRANMTPEKYKNLLKVFGIE